MKKENNMNRVKLFSVALAAILFLSGTANAEIVTYKFTGTATYGGALVAQGDKITGIFSYDTNFQPDTSLPGYADYAIPAPFVISGSVGNHIIMANNLHVSIWNNYNGNVEDMMQISGGPVVVDNNIYSNGSFGLNLASKPGSTKALQGTKLPKCLNIYMFNAGSDQTYGWLQRDGSADGQIIQFTIDSITAPEQCDHLKSHQ
jgi:hypothetical protein